MCLKCWTPSWRNKYCRECSVRKRNASAVVSQNVNKLKELLKPNWFSCTGFERFILYASNIIKHWKILLEFKDCDELRQRLVLSNYKI